MIDEYLMMWARTFAIEDVMHQLYLKHEYDPNIKAKLTRLTNKKYKELVEQQEDQNNLTKELGLHSDNLPSG